jgi:hypothetical protein
MNPKERKKLDRQYSKYGITYAQYEELWLKQGQKCALCGKIRKEGQRRFHLDHNHKTGKVRSILCFYCNRRRVGQLTYEWAVKIAGYLKKHE